MLTTGSYITAWCVYCLATVGLLVYTPWVLRLPDSRMFRLSFRMLLAGLLLTPVSVVRGGDTFAPAVIVGIFELLTEGSAQAARSGLPLAVVMVAVTLVLIAILLFQFMNTDDTINNNH